MNFCNFLVFRVVPLSGTFDSVSSHRSCFLTFDKFFGNSVWHICFGLFLCNLVCAFLEVYLLFGLPCWLFGSIAVVCGFSSSVFLLVVTDSIYFVILHGRF